MISFHKFFWFLFKSFRIDGEIQLLQKIIQEGNTEVVIIKRSWIFFILKLWMPLLLIFFLIGASYLSFYGIKIVWLSYATTFVLLFVLFLFSLSQVYYGLSFRKIHKNVEVSSNIPALIVQLQKTDTFFVRFFNWSFFIQTLIIIIFFESIILLFLGASIQSAVFIIWELFCLFISFFLLSHYRKKIMDLEMDYNIATYGKIYFVNQSWFLSQMQTIESDKIKSIQAVYPNKVAALFDFGTIHVLTEWDDRTAMWTMSMYYVKSPETTVETIQKVLTKK